ncbi:MAG TPA: hypothetical protein VIR03_03085 [Candidatus Saccharimonadales bacterium]
MGKHKRIIQRVLLAAGLVLFVVFTAGAVFAQSVAQGYQSDQKLQRGMIVRISKNDPNKVEALTQNNGEDMFGVVVASGEATVSLSNPGQNQVFVATSGKYDVLVSTQDGPIKAGDYITISSLAGVGMKAASTQQLVLGKAITSFVGDGDTETTATLTTSKGKQTVKLGHVSIDVSVAHNPLYQKQDQAGVPKFLSKAAQFVTNRPVSAFRIYASLVVLGVSLIVAGGILYAGVRTGMTAVGRNPLAKQTIFRSLIQVTLMALIVFVIGIFAVYLLLRI